MSDVPQQRVLGPCPLSPGAPRLFLCVLLTTRDRRRRRATHGKPVSDLSALTSTVWASTSSPAATIFQRLARVGRVRLRVVRREVSPGHEKMRGRQTKKASFNSTHLFAASFASKKPTHKTAAEATEGGSHLLRRGQTKNESVETEKNLGGRCVG